MTIKSMLEKNAHMVNRQNVVNRTIGVVIDSDESNNTCQIKYRDKIGKIRHKDNVRVCIYEIGANWFPRKNDTVIIEDMGESCEIVARYVGNYAMEIRAKRQLRKDIHSDLSGCCTPGGFCM